MNWLILCLLVNPVVFNNGNTVSAKVKFIDGDEVSVGIIHKDLQVKTAYGVLTIPTNKIRNITLSVKPTGDVNEALTKLGNNNHAVREEAVKYLVSKGKQSYNSLLGVVKNSKDLEVIRLAEKTLEQIKERFTPDDLQSPDTDLVQTESFLIFGEINLKSIKCKSEHFGEIEVQLDKIRQIFFANTFGVNLNIDGKYGGPAVVWLETEFQTVVGNKINITAAGSVDLYPTQANQYMTSPEGRNDHMHGQKPAGALLGKIGPNGKEFVVGNKYEGVADASGKLYLRINPSPWNAAITGSYTVNVK